MHITLFVILIFDSSKFNFDNLLLYAVVKVLHQNAKAFWLPHSQQRTVWALPPLLRVTRLSYHTP